MNLLFPTGYDPLHWAGVVFMTAVLWALSKVLIGMLGNIASQAAAAAQKK